MHFLISSERGGSNLISRMLNGHSKIHAPSPIHMIRTLMPLMDNSRSWEEIIDWCIRFFELKLVEWDVSISKKELLKHTTPGSLGTLIRYLYDKQAEANVKGISFIKEVRTYNLIPFILDNFPEAKFIYLVRDPRDMVLSWKKSPTHKGEIVRATAVWNNDQKNSLISYFNLKQSGLVYMVRYEDLVAESETILKSLCDFLKVDFEESMLSFHKGDNENKMAKATDNWKNLSNPVLKENFNKYKKNLSEEAIKYIEYINYEMMEYLGYKPEFSKISPSEFEKIKDHLSSIERTTKDEYLSLPLEERNKREAWMGLVKETNKLNIF